MSNSLAMRAQSMRLNITPRALYQKDWVNTRYVILTYVTYGLQERQELSVETDTTQDIFFHIKINEVLMTSSLFRNEN